MSIETDEIRSPGWWLLTLAEALHDRRNGRAGTRRFSRRGVAPARIRPGLVLLSDYLAGDPPLREDIHTDWAAQFRQMLRMGRLNIAELVVSARSDRLGIRDFRTAAADDELGDERARDLMRVNNLKMKVREVHDTACGLGESYTLVTPPDASRGYSLITAESPMQCITAHDPATGREIAGLKMFRDEWDSTDFAFLFLPGELYVAKAKVPTSTLFGPRGFHLTDRWEWDFDRFDDIPDGQLPLIRFRTKRGVGAIEGHLDHLDRINDKLFNEWFIGKVQAFRQRAIEVPDREDDDVDGDVEEAATAEQDDELDLAGLLTSAPDSLWQLPKGAKIWESTPADLRQLVDSIKAELQWLAAVTSTPLHTITPDAANGSAEGASLQREQSVNKAEDLRDRFEGSWARTMAMAFLFEGDRERARVEKIEPLWGPLERYSLQEKTNAASQVWGKLPSEAIYTDVMQYSPADVVERLRPLRSRDLLFLTPTQGAQQTQPRT